eukprot:PhM_4_TR8429/c0_g1_i2/m.55341
MFQLTSRKTSHQLTVIYILFLIVALANSQTAPPTTAPPKASTAPPTASNSSPATSTATSAPPTASAGTSPPSTTAPSSSTSAPPTSTASGGTSAPPTSTSPSGSQSPPTASTTPAPPTSIVSSPAPPIASVSPPSGSTPSPPSSAKCTASTRAECISDSTCSWGTQCRTACIGSQSECLSESHCSFDSGKFNACYRSSATGCGWGEQARCVDVSGCKWDASRNRCIIDDNAGCSYAEQAACLSMSTCTWSNGVCSSAPSVTSAPTVGSLCSSHTSQTSCATLQGCQWSSTECVVKIETSTPCGYGSRELCESITGCRWSSTDLSCGVGRALTPCGYGEKTACGTVTGCGWSSTNNCRSTIPSDSCATGDYELCISHPCVWADASSTSSATCSKDCTVHSAQLACDGASCYWYPGTSRCERELRCAELNIQQACDHYPDYCTWSNSACRVSQKPCSTYTTSSACTTVTKCLWANAAAPQCFEAQVSYNCTAQLSQGNCEARGCQWTGTSCRVAQQVINCEKATTSSDCYGVSPECYFNYFTSTCLNVGTINGDTHPITAVRFEPAQPQSGKPFSVVGYGRQMNKDARVVLTSSGCTSVADSTFTVGFPTFDSTSTSYVSSQFVLTQNTYNVCIRHTTIQGTTAVVAMGTVAVQTGAITLSSVTFSPASPFAGQSFAITFLGTSFSSSNKFTIVDTNAESCGSLLQVTSVSTGYDKAYASYSVPVKGTFDLCYSDGAVQFRRKSVLVVETVAPWKDAATLLAKVAAKSDARVTYHSGATSSFELFFTNASCPDQESAISRVLATPKSYTLTFGDSQRPYKPNQMCPFLIEPMSTTSSDPSATITTITRSYIDAGDALTIWAPSPSTYTYQSCTTVTDRTSCQVRGCTWSNSACTVPATPTLGHCPSSIRGYEIIAQFTYDSFTSARALGTVLIPVVYPDGAIATFCSDGASRLTGFTFSYKTQSTFCPGDCTDQSGTRRGSCSQGTCVCDSGYTGEDCSRVNVCAAKDSSAPVLRDPRLSMTITASSTSSCGYLIQPDPTLDPSLERMTSFVIALQINSLTLATTDDACTYGMALRKGSHTGSIIDSICTTGDSQLYIPSETTAIYLQFNPSAATDSFSISYAILSDVCPGPIKTGAARPTTEEECDAHGTCERDSDPTSISDATNNPYLRSCTCSATYGKTKPAGSCDTCGFGFRADSYPNCTDVSKCVVGSNDCGLRGTCVDGGCVCESEWFGNRCQEYKPSNLDIEFPASLEVRYSFDSGEAVNSASAMTDTTIMACQLPGSLFECTSSYRYRGKIYRNAIKVNATNTSATTSSFGRRLLQTTDTADRTDRDRAMTFNEILVDGNFRDMTRAMPVSGTDFDIAGTFTVTAWVKVSAETDGFLLAKIDAAFTSGGTSPVLDKALVDVKDRSIGLDNLKLGAEGENVYFAVYIDGPNEQVTVMQVKGGHAGQEKDSWHVVRHFRGRSILFDNTWRYLAISVSFSGGRYEAQLFIDGNTDSSSTYYTQCLPFLPLEADAGYPTLNDTKATVREAGGAFIVGYHFQGGIDELRVYGRRLEQFSVVNVGGDIFLGELSVDVDALKAVGYIGIAVMIIALSFPMTRFFMRGCKVKVVRDPDAVTAVQSSDAIGPDNRRATVTVGGAAVVIEKEHEKEKKKEEEGLEENKEIAVTAGHVLDVTTVNRDANDNNNTFTRALEAIEEVAEDVADQIETVADTTANETTTHTQSVFDKAKEMGTATTSAVGATKSSAVGAAKSSGAGSGAGSGGATTSGGAEGAKGGLAAAADQGKDIGVAIFRVAKEAQEYLLRLEVARDVWQVVTLFLTSFSFPEEFSTIFGRLSALIAIDLTDIYEVDISVTFYLGVSFSALCFVLVVAIVMKEKPKSKEEIAELYEQVAQDRAEAEATGEKYSKKLGNKEKVSFFALFALSTLYLPMTRNAIQIIWCHRAVQCAFDCYAEQKYWVAFIISICSGCLISIILPLFLARIIHVKRQEFLTWVGGHDAPDLDEKWKVFVRDDPSPYNSLYSGFEFRWVFLYVILMLIKAVICIPVLALPPDSTNQLIFVIIIQSCFTIMVFSTSPFLVDACDYIMQVGQAYVLFSLVISCFYRADPTWDGWAYILNVSAFLNLIFQVFFTLVSKLQSLFGG